MRIAQRKESPIIGLTGMGGGLASYILYGTTDSGETYEISRSLRFTSGDSDYLARKPSTVGNRSTWTYSCWVKRTALGAYPRMFGTYDSSYIGWDIEFNNSDQIDVHYSSTGSNYPIRRTTTAVYRDPSAWMHVVVAVDLTLGDNDNSVRVYVNGSEITDFSTKTNSSSITTTNINTVDREHRIGYNYSYSDFYLADVHFIDGQQLAASNFGETDEYGIWNPKLYTGTHGTNGFHLKFDDTSTTEALGKDSSGNGTRLPAVHFSGSNDCIEIADSSDFTFGADDFTMEMWVMPREFTSYQAFFMKHTATRSTSSVWTSLNSSGNILYYLYHGSSETGMTTSGSGLNLNKWNHIAFVRQGSTARCYINGVQEGTMDISTNTVNDSATPMRLGMDANNAYDFEGYMSNVRIVKGTCLYNDGTTFTPPTAPLTNVTNTVLLCCQSETSSSAATVAPSTGTLKLYSDNATLSPVSKSELDYDPVNLIAAQSTSTGYSDYVYAGDATYDNTETNKSYFTGANTQVNLFNGTLSGQVGAQNISAAWLYFRPATAITNVTSIRLYGSYNSGGTKINGTDSTAFPSDGQQWLSIANPPSTVTEIAVKGSGSAAARLQAIEINGVLLTDGKAGTTDGGIDSPSNYTAESGNNGGNYPTLNVLEPRDSMTFSNNNLTITSSTFYRSACSTIAFGTGKYYVEATCVTISDNNYNFVGARTRPEVESYTGSNSGDDGFDYYAGDGGVYQNTVSQATYSTWTTGDIIGLAYDGATGKCWVSKNGTWQNSGDPAAGTGHVHTISTYAEKDVFYSVAAGTNGVMTANFGRTPFVFTPPTGFVSLCTQNLPDPTILKGSEHVGVSTWTGTDISAGNTITGLEFSPDLVWAKSRSHAYNHQLTDTVRGVGKAIKSNDASEEVTNEQYGYVSAFNSDGFTSTPGSGDNDYYNGQTKDYVAWNWNAGGAASKTYTVKVVSDSGNKYRFDDFGTSAVTLDLEEGGTYVFDSSDSSVDSHPFVLGTAANSGQYGTGVTYTLDGTDVTYSAYTSGFAAATTRKLTITVPASAPILYYWCSVHSGMGGQVNTNSTSGSSNFDGAKQSTVKANPTAGFSIIKYVTSNADTVSQATFGTGLGGKPEMVLMKPLYDGGQGWTVYHKDISVAGRDILQDYLFLQSYVAVTDSGVDTFAVTSTTFGCRGSRQVAGDNQDIIVYAWRSITGYSKIGYYIGNADTGGNGPFAYTGFKPRWIMVKNASAGDSAADWLMYDTERSGIINSIDDALYANRNTDETAETTHAFDILSNGFKIRSTSTSSLSNGNNNVFVYAAFAEHPFKNVRAR